MSAIIGELSLMTHNTKIGDVVEFENRLPVTAAE
jgi:hypothetical protein